MEGEWEGCEGLKENERGVRVEGEWEGCEGWKGSGRDVRGGRGVGGM